MRDYYDILGVSRTASAREIKQAYRKLAMENHPDRNPDDEGAELRLKELNEAYEVLRDDRKRDMYDLCGKEGLRGQTFNDGAGFASVEDIFSQFGDIFGDVFGFGAEEPASGPGDDLSIELNLSFEDAVFGTQRTINLERLTHCDACEGSGAAPNTKVLACPQCKGRGQVKHQQGVFAVSSTCPRCQGSGKHIPSPCTPCQGLGVLSEVREVLIKIPGGVDEGTKLRIRQEGELGSPGHPRGDLFVILRVEPSPRFEREGLHLHTTATISCIQAMLGCTITVPTLQESASLELPEGTAHGQVLRLPKQGIQHPAKANKRGDLFVHIELSVPQGLSPKQRALLEQLQAELTPEASAQAAQPVAIKQA